MALNVIFDRIEECDCSDEASLIALPANGFFDDDCIYDPRSALGVFVQRHFKNDVAKIQELVKVALERKQTQEVLKTPGHSATSYGIGTCVFLDCPLSSNFRIAMVSVTTQRADEGLRADPTCVFSAAAAPSAHHGEPPPDACLRTATRKRSWRTAKRGIPCLYGNSFRGIASQVRPQPQGNQYRSV